MIFLKYIHLVNRITCIYKNRIIFIVLEQHTVNIKFKCYLITFINSNSSLCIFLNDAPYSNIFTIVIPKWVALTPTLFISELRYKRINGPVSLNFLGANRMYFSL